MNVPDSTSALEEKRARALSTEFEAITAPYSKPSIVLKDLEDFFARTARPCDRLRLAKVFLQLDSSRQHKLTRSDYVQRAISAEALLASKIAEHRKNLECFAKQTEEVVQKLAEAKATENVNCHGIMEDSWLTVWVVELKGFFPQDLRMTASPFVVAKLGEQRQHTACANTMLDPVWNEDLTFTVYTGEERLVVELWTSQGESGRFEAACELGLGELRDQIKQERLLDLRSPSGKPISGRIHVFVQWIYSGVQYFADLRKRLEDKATEEQKCMEEAGTELAKLREPYGMMLHYNPPEMVDGPSPYRGSSSLISLATEQSLPPVPSVIRPSRSFLMCDNILWMIFIMSSMINAFIRADFVNSTVGVLGIATNALVGNREPERMIRLGMFCLTFAVIFDVVWFSVIGSSHLNPQGAGLVVVSAANLALKLLLFFRLKKGLADAGVLSLLEYRSNGKIREVNLAPEAGCT